MALRHEGAPRLIEWTGERCVPWAPNVQVVYEHYHRYLWARSLMSGRRVLDLGSGEGFGSALLRETASEVVGIDVDERTVEHSRLNYAGPSLDFMVASAADLSAFEDDSFDAVVAFEVIEHIAEQEAVLAEIARVLRAGGLLLISTPDRLTYSKTTGQENPFHERELSQAELRDLLGRHFGSLELFAQRTATGSRIEALDPGRPGGYLDVEIERDGDEWKPGGSLPPLYLIAVASTAPLPELPSSSTLSDYGIGLLREEQQAHATTKMELGRAQASAQRNATEAERLSDELSGMADQLESERRARANVPGASDSVLWRMLEALRTRFYGAIGGRDSLIGRTMGATLRWVGRRLDRRSWQRDPLVLLPAAEPDVSIVIPVHSGATLTENCLQALQHTTEGVAYEVIVVDDVADAQTKQLLATVQGIRVIANATNRGFLDSVNVGAASARGRHIVLLNNDTQPHPHWLTALVERAESADDVGVVAAKLVYPDGTLQEAGGIVRSDGHAANYGRGRPESEPQFNYVREVDYGSGAALLVRAELWEALGGFDERYAPGYYEDADLCFAARDLGWKVLYEPKAVVMHLEGASMGTDEEAGGKRFQRINRLKFAEKWSEALKEQQLDDDSWERMDLAADRRRGPGVLVIDHRVPAPDRDAGSQRMWCMLRALRELDCRVTFLPDDGASPEPYASDLQGLGVEVLSGPIVLPERIAGLAPRLELALLSRPYVAPRYLHLVREFAPAARIAYDTVDLHFLREERRIDHDPGANPRLAEGYRELELALGRAADVTIAISSDERKQLLAAEPELEIEVVPMANELFTEIPGPESRGGLLFVGGFEHLPNIDAAVYLAEEIMPRVRSVMPDVQLTIVGSNAPPEVTGLDSPGVEVAGWVEDLDSLLRTRLAMVAPLRFGAGMKGKVTQSLAAGLPVVTTTIGAEGLDVSDGEELLIADDPDGFAERIVRLHREAHTWRRLSEHGQALAERTCSQRVQREALRRLLDQDRSALNTSWSPAPK